MKLNSFLASSIVQAFRSIQHYCKILRRADPYAQDRTPFEIHISLLRKTRSWTSQVTRPRQILCAKQRLVIRGNEVREIWMVNSETHLNAFQSRRMPSNTKYAESNNIDANMHDRTDVLMQCTYFKAI
jgi:hypothetical protein